MAKLIRAKEVAKKVTLSVSHVYRLARDGKFPKPRKLSANTTVWVEEEIDQWISERLGLNSKEVA